MPKYIREARIGASFTYKTGAVVGTYPKPMLVLEFDPGGLDVVKQPVVWATPSEAEQLVGKTEQAPITSVDFSTPIVTLDLLYAPVKNSERLQQLVSLINKLLSAPALPWKTVVLDHVTGLSDAVLQHISRTASTALDDARRWASMVGLKVQQTLAALVGLKAHTVCIFHTEIAVNETTNQVSVEVLMPSKLRYQVGRLFSQYFVSDIISGKPVVYTKPKGYIHISGARFPEGLPEVCGADFQSIYGKEKDLA